MGRDCSRHHHAALQSTGPPMVHHRFRILNWMFVQFVSIGARALRAAPPPWVFDQNQGLLALRLILLPRTHSSSLK